MTEYVRVHLGEIAALGHYSYGIYLWHWPLWLLLRSLLPQWGAWHADRLLSFTFILTVLFAFASWRLFEKPVARAGFIALIRPISGDEAEHCGRLISTVVVLACSWSFCGYAVATASEQTSVAQSLHNGQCHR